MPRNAPSPKTPQTKNATTAARLDTSHANARRSSRRLKPATTVDSLVISPVSAVNQTRQTAFRPALSHKLERDKSVTPVTNLGTSPETAEMAHWDKHVSPVESLVISHATASVGGLVLWGGSSSKRQGTLATTVENLGTSLATVACGVAPFLALRSCLLKQGAAVTRFATNVEGLDITPFSVRLKKTIAPAP